MKLGVMQPYFLPYLGYFQLINAVDEYIIFDDAQYSKKGWYNRNRILQNGEASYISISLKKAPLETKVNKKLISTENYNKKRILGQISSNYHNAPYINEAYPIIEQIIHFPDLNLAHYLENSIRKVCDYLNIKTPIIISSDLDIDPTLRSVERAYAYCRNRKADIFINAIGGQKLYSKDKFRSQGVEIQFLASHLPPYKQFSQAFVPGLSILDIMMFNSPHEIQKMLLEYTLI